MTEDYLTTSTSPQACVWCSRHILAGTRLELVVERGERRWWSCAPCAAETRTGAVSD